MESRQEPKAVRTEHYITLKQQVKSTAEGEGQGHIQGHDQSQGQGQEVLVTTPPPSPRRQHRSFHKTTKKTSYNFLEMNVQDLGEVKSSSWLKSPKSPVKPVSACSSPTRLDTGHYLLQKANTDPCKQEQTEKPGIKISPSASFLLSPPTKTVSQDITMHAGNPHRRLNRSLSPKPANSPDYLDPDSRHLVRKPLPSPVKITGRRTSPESFRFPPPHHHLSASSDSFHSGHYFVQRPPSSPNRLGGMLNFIGGGGEIYGWRCASNESLTVGSIGETPPSPSPRDRVKSAGETSPKAPATGVLVYGPNTDRERSLTPTRLIVEEGYKWTRSLSEKMKGMRDTAFSAVAKKYRHRKIKGKMGNVMID